MVGRWGMSETIGPIAVLPADGHGPLLPGASEVSRATRSELIDEEVRRIVDEAHEEVVALLAREPRRSSTALAEALLEHETLDEDDAYAAAGVPHEHEVPAEAAAFAAAMTTRDEKA